MLGLMQRGNLTVDKFLAHAARWHANQEVVSRTASGALVRVSYAELHKRSKQVSNALVSLGIKPGDRVATLASNTARHMEVWYGTMGLGAVCHTLNPRLFLDQLSYIAHHAGDRIVFADECFVPLLTGLLKHVPTIECVILFREDQKMVVARHRTSIAETVH